MKAFATDSLSLPCTWHDEASLLVCKPKYADSNHCNNWGNP